MHCSYSNQIIRTHTDIMITLEEFDGLIHVDEITVKCWWWGSLCVNNIRAIGFYSLLAKPINNVIGITV